MHYGLNLGSFMLISFMLASLVVLAIPRLGRNARLALSASCVQYCVTVCMGRAANVEALDSCREMVRLLASNANVELRAIP